MSGYIWALANLMTRCGAETGLCSHVYLERVEKSPAVPDFVDFLYYKEID